MGTRTISPKSYQNFVHTPYSNQRGCHLPNLNFYGCQCHKRKIKACIGSRARCFEPLRYCLRCPRVGSKPPCAWFNELIIITIPIIIETKPAHRGGTCRRTSGRWSWCGWPAEETVEVQVAKMWASQQQGWTPRPTETTGSPDKPRPVKTVKTTGYRQGKNDGRSRVKIHSQLKCVLPEELSEFLLIILKFCFSFRTHFKKCPLPVKNLFLQFSALPRPTEIFSCPPRKKKAALSILAKQQIAHGFYNILWRC